MKSVYRPIEQAIGYRFRKKEHLRLALTHPSYRYEHADIPGDNQRLEYLGDAALSLVCAEHLFKTDSEAREGKMSKLRSRLTEDRKLAQIAKKINLGTYLLLGRGEEKNGGAQRASNLADALEALIGAAWIDGGIRAVKKIFNRIFLPELEAMQAAPGQANPKGNLQEYAQSHGLQIPSYTLLNTEGPEHDRTFTLQVEVAEKKWDASASSKREAERQAAAKALKELLQE
jgi:ribonuclease-3